MVFESIVTELINRYLGSFVENLDSSQLKIGIWGGDVVLNNLNLKESALDELDLPVKIKAGHIGKLTLKIPWKNLYTEPVIAEIEGIYALAVPNIDIKYDEEKNNKYVQEVKQAKLAKIEEQKKLEEEKNKPKDPKKDSFAEKLATQVIKNLQVRVSQVHVRYEDSYTNPSSPVSIGVTMGQLLFQTTDENWKEAVIKEAVTQIYKLIRLDNLAVYWNSKSELLHKLPKDEILEGLVKPPEASYYPEDEDSDVDQTQSTSESMKSSFAILGNKPKLQYMFKPISAVAHLKLNTKPEQQEFTIPKIFLSLVFDNIALSLTKGQYDDILLMLDSKERMDLLALNKKTRPDAPYIGNAKAWWHHAYSRILENDVQRRRKMWSWDHIKCHRRDYYQYKELYVKKLNKKLGGKELTTLNELEKNLDVLNIMLARTQAEGVVAKEGKKKADEKAQGGGWFSGWFGGGSKKTDASTSAGESAKGSLGDLGQELQKEFDAKEQAKLYKAIGYDEGVPDTTFPTEFVAVRVVTKLNKLSFALIDDTQHRQALLKSTLSEIYVSFGQRPSANAIRVDSKVSQLLVTGRSQGGKDFIPKMVASVKTEDTALLSVMFETNPLEGDCDSRARVKSEPVEIIYDANTINSLAGFFKPPEDIRLKNFSEAAMARYTEIKEQTAIGMVHAMEEKKYMDLQVDLRASYILLPATGTLRKDVNMLMLNLGSLKVSSEKNQTSNLDITKMTKEEVHNLAYDKFNISLNDVQLLFVQPGDSWQGSDRSSQSPMYILRPLSLSIGVEKCIFNQDPNLPQMRVKGELPLVSVALSDTKLIGMMNLIQSIPLPESSEPAEDHNVEDNTMSIQSSLAKEVDLKRLNLRSDQKDERSNSSQFTNFTSLAMTFQIFEISLEVFQTVDEKEEPLIKLIVSKIGAHVKQRTFDMVVDAFLGAIYLQHLQYKLTPGVIEQLKKCNVITGELVNIINTPKLSDETPLLSINFLQADKKGPEFATVYNNTAQSITVQFATLDFIIHQTVILSLMKFAKKFETPAEAPTGSIQKARKHSLASSISSYGHKLEAKRLEKVKKAEFKEIVQLKLKGLVEGIRVGLCSENSFIMDASIGGIEAGLSMYKTKLGVSALIRRIDILDPDPSTVHKHIVTVSGSDVLSFNMMMYNDGTKDHKFDNTKNVDMDISVSMGRTKVTFVNKFVASILNFLDNFSVAKAKLEEAGKAAREKSKNMAKNIKEHASRIKLSVSLKAPLIIFPRSSKSTEVLLINLGDINLENAFESLSTVKTKPGMAQIVEALSVTLTNLRVSRGITDVSEVKVEINILEPISFKVDLKRNLSEGWFHGIPDIALHAMMETVQVSLSFGDLQMIMLALDENLKEQAAGMSQPKSEEVKEIAEMISTIDLSNGADLEPYKEFSGTALEAVSEEAYTKIKLDFEMVSFILGLYKGSSNLDNPQAMMTRPADKHLGEICVRNLKVDFSMMSDQAMNGSVILKDITLDDMRVEKKSGITKMVHPLNKSSEEVINVKFTQNAQQDKVLDIHISSLHICVCMEFLMRIVDFFTKSMPPPKPKTIQQAKEEQIQQIQESEKAKERASEVTQMTLKKESQVDNATTTAPTGTLNLSLKLEKPEIILIEDQMNKLTNSLIVDVGVTFNLRTNESNDQMITGSIDGLSLISCVYKKDDSEKSNKGFRIVPKMQGFLRVMLQNFYPDFVQRMFILRDILNPCDITLVCNAPGGKNHHANIEVSDIILDISPSTIQLLSSVASGMVVASEDGKEMTQPLQDYNNIWLEKDLNTCSFWFSSAMKSAKEVENPEMAVVPVKEESTEVERGEHLILSAPLMIIKLEGGVGHRTVPLLIFEAAFSAQVTDWSSLLHVDSSFSIEMAYYNEKLGAWEPVIEPVVTGVGKEQRKWELSLEVLKNEDFVFEEEVDAEQIQVPPPKMVISVTASEPLQVVVTKTCLDVLTHLGRVFNDAYQLQEMEGMMGEKVIPYVIKNETGKKMKMLLDSSFEIAPESAYSNVDDFDTGCAMSINNKTGKKLVSQKSVIRKTQEQEEKKIGFQFSESSEVAKFEASVKKAGRRLFTLPITNSSGEKYKVVCNVDAEIGQKIVSFTSILKVYNHLENSVKVFYKDSNDSPVSCGVVAPLNHLWLPLDAVYTAKGQVCFQPLPKEEERPLYDMTEGQMSWKDIGEGGKIKELSCKPTTEGNSPFFFNVVALIEQVPIDESPEQTGPVITFNLHPTVMLHNLLPYDIKFLLEGTPDLTLLKAGHYMSLDHASVNQSNLELVIPDYQGKEWSGRKLIKLDVPPLSVWSFTAYDAGKKISMDLGLHCKMNKGSFDVTLYCPYWIINMSQQQLAIKEDDKEAPFIQKPEDSIMLFFFKDKPFFGSSKKKKSSKCISLQAKRERIRRSVRRSLRHMGIGGSEVTSSTEKKKPGKEEKVKELKKPGKVQLKIGDGSDWSDKFSLDTVGSSGNVVCKHKLEGHNVEVGVKIVLSASGLTKVVTFTPFYMMLNASTVPICVREETLDKWIQVQPGECKPLYPEAGGKSKDIKMVAQVMDSDNQTVPFLINKAHTSLLRLENKYGGLSADCQVRESAMITTFALYQPGMATVQIVNQSSKSVVSFHQSGVKDKVIELKPMTSILYTWDDPTGKLELLWSCDLKKNVKGTIDQDGIDKFQANKGEDMFWVSFLDGMQRVLMFTQEEGLANMASGAQRLEQANTSLMLGIHDMGLSLLNNEEMVEVAYMGITSSGVIWEEKKKRFKVMKVKDCIILEHAYQKYLLEKETGKRKPGSTLLENKLEVDFESMTMIKPRKTPMRRSFEDGMWMELKISEHSKQFHAKINRMQLDNQLRHAVFPTILSPMPPPKSVAAESVPKPFVEISLIVQTQEHSSLLQIKYFRVLIQEMNLKVDQGFLNALLGLFASGAELNRDNEFVEFEADVAKSKHDLKEEAGLSIQQAQPNFYDSFHISPIKIHLSFSLQGGESGGTAIQSDVLNVFLQSVGVVLTDVQDVVFKLGYFERNHTFYDSKKLTSEFIRHYSGQAIKQMYVLILGLDVLGNPFGLLRGLGEGIEDLFYEPYQGAIQGPEEFAEGLALGVRSLFGHAVGGAAGAVSRITGTVGKGLAALTLDDDYQKKRREQMNKKPASAKEGFARGGKGLVMGVFDGVTGIVRKPVEGAKQDGVSGFFKGMGKGLVGVVTRPTSGVVDFASSSLEGIRRITDVNEEIHRLRPPRRLQKDGIIRPYIREEAEGYYLLGETEKGKYIDTDEYLMHVNLKDDGKTVLLVTDKRVMQIKRGDIFGSWDTDWVLTYQEMRSIPKQTSKGMEILLKEEKKKKLFGGSVVKKDVHISDPKVVESVIQKITKAMHDLNVENCV